MNELKLLKKFIDNKPSITLKDILDEYAKQKYWYKTKIISYSTYIQSYYLIYVENPKTFKFSNRSIFDIKIPEDSDNLYVPIGKKDIIHYSYHSMNDISLGKMSLLQNLYSDLTRYI